VNGSIVSCGRSLTAWLGGCSVDEDDPFEVADSVISDDDPVADDVPSAALGPQPQPFMRGFQLAFAFVARPERGLRGDVRGRVPAATTDQVRTLDQASSEKRCPASVAPLRKNSASQYPPVEESSRHARTGFASASLTESSDVPASSPMC
jgi:hypothetical protein